MSLKVRNYTCDCGREGDKDWMTVHLIMGHNYPSIRDAKKHLMVLPYTYEWIPTHTLGPEIYGDK